MAARTGSSAAHYKVVLCGQFGVGKTSVMRRFLNDSFVEKVEEVRSELYNSTAENGPSRPASVRSTLDCYCRTFPTFAGRTIQLELWDTAGMERFRSLSASYYVGAAAALICYAVNDRDSFQAAAEYIVEALDVFGRSPSSAGAVVFLCGNKTDVFGGSGVDDAVSAATADRLAAEYEHIVSRSYRVSCRTGDGVRTMFDDIAAELDRRALDKADRTAGTIVISTSTGSAASDCRRRPIDTICSC